MPSGDADRPKLNPKQTGNVRLEIQFRTALNANITILVWGGGGEFESVIYIDHPACKGTEPLVGQKPWNWLP